MLVAEGSERIRHRLAHELARAARPVQVVQARDADSAREAARSARPSAVLLDLRIPGAMGLELLADLVALLPDAAILVLGFAVEERLRRRCLELGARAVFDKGGQFLQAIAAVDLMFGELHGAAAGDGSSAGRG